MKKKVYAEDVLQAVCVNCDSRLEMCEECPIKDAIMNAPDADEPKEQKLTVIEYAKKMQAYAEERDDEYLMTYWSAYLDGARRQKQEDEDD